MVFLIGKAPYMSYYFFPFRLYFIFVYITYFFVKTIFFNIYTVFIISKAPLYITIHQIARKQSMCAVSNIFLKRICAILYLHVVLWLCDIRTFYHLFSCIHLQSKRTTISVSMHDIIISFFY